MTRRPSTAERPAIRPPEKPLGVWEDATSYSQSDTYPRKPRSWRLRVTRDVHIVVVSEHIYYKGEWVVSCAPWFETTRIGLMATPDNSSEAQRLALAMVRKKVNELYAALMSICQ